MTNIGRMNIILNRNVQTSLRQTCFNLTQMGVTANCKAWETHIPSDMCSSIWETHIPSDMCSPTWETCIPGDVFPHLGNMYPW